MRETLRMDNGDCLEHLLEIVLADVFGERSRVGDVVEELSSSDKFLSYVGNFNLCTIAFGHDGRLFEFKVFCNMFVFKRGRSLNFPLEVLEDRFIKLWVLQTKDLESVLSAVFSRSMLDFGAKTFAQGST